MSQGHDIQELVGPKGSVIKACRFCLAKEGDAKLAQPCTANAAQVMPPKNGREPYPVLGPGEIVPLGGPATVVKVVAMSAVELVQSLDAQAIESKITELRGEIAALEVLLAAAKARDKKAKVESA